MTHDDLMAKLLADIQIRGAFDVKAHNFAFYPAPSKIVWTETQHGHIPDVTATLWGKQFVFEVETEDSILIDHTLSQLQLFATYAQGNNGICCLVVPRTSHQDAKAAALSVSPTIQVVSY